MSSTPPRGRPRSPASREAILKATFDLLCERGYAGLAIEAVARRAVVGKTTIYRWWAGRAELAVDAFFFCTQSQLEFPNTGSAREDFRQQIRQLAQLLRQPAGNALAAMIAGAPADASLHAAILERWIIPRKRWGHERLTRAQMDGEAPVDLPIDAALNVLYGPLYARLLIGLNVPSDNELDDHLEIVFRGIFTTKNRGSGS